MARTSLPPGFRFHPTDVELIMYYLKRKVMGKKFRFEAIAEINIYKFSPWDLPDQSCLQSRDREWYFFCPRERRYASGGRMSRTTETGYWKTTGNDRRVSYNEQKVGMIKTLVFHLGHAPGKRTDWVMYEYRIEDKGLADAGVVQDSYVLCKFFEKSGPGPKNGAQYGAIFNEEDWDHDEEDGPFPQALVVADNQNSSVVTSMVVQESIRTGSLSEPGPSNVVPQLVPDSDDLDSLMACLVEDGTCPSADANQIAIPDSLNPDERVAAVSLFDGNEIYEGLGDLGSILADLSGDRFDFSSNSKAHDAVNPMFPPDNVAYLELNDLDIPLSFHAEAGGSESFPADNMCGSEFQNLFSCGESNHYPVNFFGALQHVSGPSLSPLAPDGFNGHGDHIGLFQKGNDAGESSNQIRGNDAGKSSNQGWATTSGGF